MVKPYLFIIASALCLALIEMIGQYNLKEYNIKHSYGHYLVGIFFYIITLTIYANMLSYEKIGIVNHLWNIFSSLFAFILGKLFFAEVLTFYEILGAMLSMAGIALMGIKN